MKVKKPNKIRVLFSLLCAMLLMGFLFVPALAWATASSSMSTTHNQDNQSAHSSESSDNDVSTNDVDNDCITISSATKLQLATKDLQKHWDGTMEYSTDKTHWNSWDGNFINSAECYLGMFTRCLKLQKAPELPANELVEGCYSELFLACQSLTVPADISKVTKLAHACCSRMYEGCLNLAIYKEMQSGRTKEWKATCAAQAVDGWSEGMLNLTCGDFTDNPVAGTTYYIADNAPTAHTAISAGTEGGFISIHQRYFIAGRTVEATAVPYDGYVTSSFVAKDVFGNEIPIVNDTFTMPDSDVTIIAIFKKDIQQCNISGIDQSYTYTGAAIEPSVTVKNGDTTLVLDKDYIVSYTDNINVGTATVTITGKGDYAGSVDRTFSISKAIITITPKTGQSKVVGADDPILTFDATGAVASEKVGTSGRLAREEGEDIGSYTITLGTLALADNGTFKAANYSLKFSDTPVLFTIKAPEAYNLTVGNTLVGADSKKWQGSGENVHYAYSNESMSYEFYPSTSTLKLKGGTVKGHFTYTCKGAECEVSNTIALNSVSKDYEVELTALNNLTIEAADDTQVIITNLNNPAIGGPITIAAIGDGEAGYTPDAQVSIFGTGVLTINTDGVINADEVHCVKMGGIHLGTETQTANVRIATIRAASLGKAQHTYCSFLGFRSEREIEIAKGSDITFDSVEVDSLSNGRLTGFFATRGLVIGEDSKVCIHRARLDCPKSSIGDSAGITFLEFGAADGVSLYNYGSIEVAPEQGDSIVLNCTNSTSDISKCALVAGVKVYRLATECNLYNYGRFVMENVTVNFNQSATSGEENLLVAGIDASSKNYGELVFDGADFIFNALKNSSVNFKGSKVAGCVSSCNFGGILELIKTCSIVKSTINVNAPRITVENASNALYLYGLQLASQTVDIKDSTLNVNIEQVAFDARESDSVYLAGVRFDMESKNVLSGTTRVNITCPTDSEFTGIMANSNTLSIAEDTLLTISASKSQQAIANWKHAYDNILTLSKDYVPAIRYGLDAQSAQGATALDSAQYGKNPYFSICNSAYDFTVTFDAQGGSTPDPQIVHNGFCAKKPTDPTREGYTFGGWYNDAACLEAFDFSTPITRNTTLYAKWDKFSPAPTPSPSPTSTSTATSGSAGSDSSGSNNSSVAANTGDCTPYLAGGICLVIVAALIALVVSSKKRRND